ncbi:hypothetical protein DBB_43930 [Desulfoluna spongiiphila]|nr:hypothetical protein DBB_43930 [Desulfoluna spongiiphila]
MVVFIFIYFSALYWLVRRSPRGIATHTFRVLLLVPSIVPVMFFFLLIQTPITQIGPRISALFRIREEEMFGMAFSVLLFLFSALAMHFSLDHFHMAYTHLWIKWVCTIALFMLAVECFCRKKRT